MITLTVVELMPANLDCSSDNEMVHFCAIFGVSCLNFSTFGWIYGWTLIKRSHDGKWRSVLAGCFGICIMIVIWAMISLIVMFVLSWDQRFLLVVGQIEARGERQY